MQVIAAMWYLSVVILIVLAWLARRWMNRRRQGKSAPPESIVLFHSHPISLNATTLAQWFGAAAGCEVEVIDSSEETGVEPDEPAPTSWLTGQSPHFICCIRGTMFMAHNLSAPYMTDPLGASQGQMEMRLSKAIKEHKAWASVDVLHPQEATAENYRIVAMVAAKMVGPDCLALYSPKLSKFAPCMGDETIEKLLSADPLQAVFVEHGTVPVIPMQSDDPRLLAAEAEARSRFHEFESAFNSNSNGGSHFSVKTMITRGDNSEHIWVDVTRIEGETLLGLLGNEPVDLGDLKLGSEVSLDRSQVEDWAIMRGGELIGAFTLTALQNAHPADSGGDKQ
ncbi:DUF2314 domain-containing protein [Paludibaculum fermentans]|uniref:DUF2314 domain-containing protein n=1 Tax=Paludibaculum fermentans TaxID=1473598 RepID=UPI003EB90160